MLLRVIDTDDLGYVVFETEQWDAAVTQLLSRLAQKWRLLSAYGGSLEIFESVYLVELEHGTAFARYYIHPSVGLVDDLDRPLAAERHLSSHGLARLHRCLVDWSGATTPVARSITRSATRPIKTVTKPNARDQVRQLLDRKPTQTTPSQQLIPTVLVDEEPEEVADDTSSLGSLDSAAFEETLKQLEEAIGEEEKELEQLTAAQKISHDNLAEYTHETAAEKNRLQREKDEEESRERIFKNDRDTVYARFKEQQKEHPDLPIPVMFRKKYPLLEFLDQKGVLEDEKAYAVYLVLYNTVYGNTRRRDEMLPDKINYLTQNRLDELIEEVGDYIDLIDDYADAHRQKYPSLEQVLQEIDETDSVDTETGAVVEDGETDCHVEALMNTTCGAFPSDDDQTRDTVSLDSTESVLSESEDDECDNEEEEVEEEYDEVAETAAEKRILVNRIAATINSSRSDDQSDEASTEPSSQPSQSSPASEA